jgi:hypothetical protein
MTNFATETLNGAHFRGIIGRWSNCKWKHELVHEVCPEAPNQAATRLRSIEKQKGTMEEGRSKILKISALVHYQNM